MRKEKMRHKKGTLFWGVGLLMSALCMGQADLTAYAKDVDIEMDAWKLPANGE